MVTGPEGHGHINHPSQDGLGFLEGPWLCLPGLASSTVLPPTFLVSTDLSGQQLRTPLQEWHTWDSPLSLRSQPPLPLSSHGMPCLLLQRAGCPPGAVTDSCLCILSTELAQKARKGPTSDDTLLHAECVLDSVLTRTHQVHRTAPFYR